MATIAKNPVIQQPTVGVLNLDPKQVTHEHLIRRWARYSLDEGLLVKSTIDRYSTALQEWGDFLECDHKHMLTASEMDVAAYLEWASNRREITDARYGEDRISLLSPSSRKLFLAALRGFYKYLRKIDPSKRLVDITEDIKRPKIEIIPPDVLDTDELSDFLNAKGTAQNRVMAYLYVYTACRNAEIRNLRWRDVDFRNASIRIKVKGGEYRYLPMHDAVLTVMKEWEAQQLEEGSDAVKRALRNRTSDSAYVMLTKYGNRLGADAPWRMMVRRAARAGIRVQDPGKNRHGRTKDNRSEIKVHLLRASWATKALSDGAPIDAVSDVLGHKSITTTQKHYLNPSEQRRRATIQSFNI